MFSKLLRYMTAAAVLFSAASCADNVDAPDQELVPDSPGTVTIRFNNSTVSRSEASDNSETLIANAIVALYPAGIEENVNAVAVSKFSSIAENVDATVTMRLTELMVNTLFNNGTDGSSCRIYALVNYPEGAVFSEKPTIAELKSVPVTSTFDTEKVQQSFIMTGEGTVAYTAGSNAADPGKASAKVELYRAAAKIRINVNLPASIVLNAGTEDEETWEPESNGIQVMLNNGVKSAIACPVPAEGQVAWVPGEDAYYDSQMNTLAFNSAVPADGYPYTLDVPFYTYPNVWEEKPEETHKTTMTLVVPWKRTGEDSWHNYYYQVPITPATLPHIDRNYSYNVNLRVGMLGSLVPETPLELTDLNYQVVNWSAQTVNVDIKDFRYLVVNPNAVSVQNEGEVLIPFYSSHPVDVQNISMTFQRFNFYSNGNGDVVEIEVPKTKLDASETTTNGTTHKMVEYEVVTDPATNQQSLKIKHPLEIWTPVNAAGQEVALTGRNNIGQNTLTAVTNSIVRFVRPTTPEAPYSSYTFKVHIQHDDNTSYAEDITITQYPAMYIEAKRNPGNGTTTNSGGNVYVNNGQTGGDNNTLGSVTSNLSGNNSNPNMYIITVSQLDASSKYIIGDPRANFYQNTLSTNNNADLPVPTSNGGAAGARTNNNGMTRNNWCQTSNALYPVGGGQRTLTYYYPTLEGQEDVYKMKIAPKFRVASSYGKTQPMERNGARRRMATYQELNCPAGRWRLPTYGELEFIISLSNTGKIPVLYSSGTYYWTAQGACLVNSDGTITLNTSRTDDVYCRGVYDEWYWEQYPQYSISPTGTNYTYTLGDVPRGAQ